MPSESTPVAISRYFGGANNGGRADDLNVVIGPVRVLGDDAPELTGEALVHSGRNV